MDFAKVDREIDAGRLWRAKEMLQGALSQATFDDRLLEKYGQVLLAMGDTLEAGRYLFASGTRRAEYVQPITLFLDRHRKADSDALLGEMPAMLRRHQATLGEVIKTPAFADSGFPENIRRELGHIAAERQKTSTISASLDIQRPIIIGVIMVILAIFLVGLFTTVSFLFHRIF